MRFRPRLWPTAITLPALLILIALGTWQVDRHAWKQGLLADLEARTQQQPRALPRSIGDPAAIEFLPFRIRGEFIQEGELYWGARTHQGRSGYHVITPLRLADGREILVDRGWVPPEAKDPAARPDSLVEGAVELVGHARRGGWRGAAWMRPANDPAANIWLWPDLPGMAAAAGLDRPVSEIYLTVAPGTDQTALPIAKPPPIDLPDNHLQYALTWYALAAVLLVIYLLFHRRARDRPSAG